MGRNLRRKDIVRCPRCEGDDLWLNGFSSGKQRFKCKACEKEFVPDPFINGLVVELADRMLKEELPVPVITKILEGHVSRRWLYTRKGKVCQSR